MTSSDINVEVVQAATARIFETRDLLLRQQAELKEQQAVLAGRERDIDRQLAECRAAARFFGIEFDPPPSAREIEDLQNRSRAYRARGLDLQAKGEEKEGGVWLMRSRMYADQARALVEKRDADGKQGRLPVPAPLASPIAAELKPAAESKIPKIRDILLDTLRTAGRQGGKAAEMRQYIESTYHTQIHEKTVGMTLYRLSKEDGGLVHRKGQTWFYGPQAGPIASPASTENPGGDTPGPTHVAG